MTPSGIAAEVKASGLTNVTLPTCDVANKAITSGSDARCFAQYMRIHALEATGGKTYSQMPRYATADGKGTNDAAAAQKGPTGQPLDNVARNVWVTETALSTALNMSYMATQVANFGIVVGIALLLTGIGFGILALGGALRSQDSVLFGKKEPRRSRQRPRRSPRNGFCSRGRGEGPLQAALRRSRDAPSA